MHGDGATAASIHDGVRAKEAHLADHLVYDTHERRSGLVRLLPADVTAEAWATAAAEDLADTVDRRFEVVELAPGRLTVRRDTTVAGGSLDPRRQARSRWAAAGSTPRSTSSSKSRTRATVPSRRASASSGRPPCWAAAGTPRPGGRSAARGPAMTARVGGARDSARAGQRLDRDRHRDHRLAAGERRGGRRSRRSRTRRAGSSARTRAADFCCRGRSCCSPVAAGRSRWRTP